MKVPTAISRRAGRGVVLAGWLALLAPLAQAQSQAEQPEGRVLERVVAVIEGQVLTLSELEFEARVALVERGTPGAAQAPLDEEMLRGALELSISQRLQVLGAKRLQAFPVEPAEVEARLQAFERRFSDEASFRAFLARHDVDRARLGALLERSLRAERILDSRVRLRAQVDEAEVRRYCEEHREDFPSGCEASRAAARERLVRERYGALAAEELAQVRVGAQVRRVAPFVREARP